MTEREGERGSVCVCVRNRMCFCIHHKIIYIVFSIQNKTNTIAITIEVLYNVILHSII